MACVRKFEVPPPETHNNCDAIFKSLAVAMPPDNVRRHPKGVKCGASVVGPGRRR